MDDSSQIYKRFILAGLALLGVILTGTFGYWLITGRVYSFFDTFYMTFITIATIGFGETIDISHNTGGRLFTVFISIAGIGVLAYMATNVTAFLVEGELKDSFRRRKMENRAKVSKDHYIICGLGSVSFHVISELRSTNRSHVVLNTGGIEAEKALEPLKDEIILQGDATDNDVLLKAGIKQAVGLFAVTDDDNQNLVICLTARQLNPSIRIVACCKESRNSEKMSRAGANAVVSPALIGGLRIASEMVRPTVVSFLDIMLRDHEKNLRVEEVTVPDFYSGKPLSSLDLRNKRQVLLLAVRTKDGWEYNPNEGYTLKRDSILVIMTDPAGKKALEKTLFDATLKIGV